MAYTPTLRHLSLLFTLPLGFFVGSVITQLKLQGVSLARSPLREGGCEPDEEAVQKAAIEQKKRNWNFVSSYFAFLAVLFYGANEWPNTFSAATLVLHTLLMGYISRTVLSQLLGSSTTLLSRPNDGTLLQEISTPFTLSSAVLSLLSLTLFPCIILFPSFLPFFTVLSFSTTVLFIQNSPWTLAKDAVVSLRWAFTLFLAFELFIVFIGVGTGLAVKEGIFDNVGSWLEGVLSDGSTAAAEEVTKDVAVEIEPFLGNLILEGMIFLQPFVWFMTTGWLLSLLYRLDVHISEQKVGKSLVGVEEFGRSPSTKSFFKGETGQKITLPPLRSAIKRHFQTAISTSLPTYFLTGTAVFTSLLLLSPFVLAHFESGSPASEINDDLQAFSNRREAVELETIASLVAVVLSPWIITVAIGVVSFFKGEGRLVWNYREVWGESKGEVGDGEEAKSVLRAGEEKREHEVLSV